MEKLSCYMTYPRQCLWPFLRIETSKLLWVVQSQKLKTWRADNKNEKVRLKRYDIGGHFQATLCLDTCTIFTNVCALTYCIYKHMCTPMLYTNVNHEKSYISAPHYPLKLPVEISVRTNAAFSTSSLILILRLRGDGFFSGRFLLSNVQFSFNFRHIKHIDAFGDCSGIIFTHYLYQLNHHLVEARIPSDASSNIDRRLWRPFLTLSGVHSHPPSQFAVEKCPFDSSWDCCVLLAQ